jgi:hypothetical protein
MPRLTIVRCLFVILAVLLVAGPARAQPLLINEVDYDQIGTDNDEFLEILNASASNVNLADYTLYFVNGSGNTVYLTIPLAPAGIIGPGQYLVICSNSVTPAPGALIIRFATASNNIQNGAPDGIALVNTATNSLVDSLSYEGAMTAVTLPGVGLVTLVHGTAIPAATADSNTIVESLCRVSNGHASGNDLDDWHLLATPTPGAANATGACTPAPLAINPDPTYGCPGQTAAFTATMSAAVGQAPFSYTWRRNGQPVTIGGRITSTPSGDTFSCTLSIGSLVPNDAGAYDVSVSGGCGLSQSTAAGLFVAPADVGVQGGVPGQDGLYDNNDFVVFINAFFNSQPAADIGRQGGLFGPDGLFDNNDFVVFINFFFAGCP